MSAWIRADMYDQLTDVECVCVPPRLWGAGSAIRCELGRIKNESAAMHY